MNERYEKPTEALRQVRDSKGHITSVQVRWTVQSGPIRYIEPTDPNCIPPADPSTWMNHPQIPLCWFPIRSEWRDLPTVTPAEVAAEKLESGEKPTISTE